jgi:Helix-turn-helix of DDE superfamily endonuclease
MFWKVLSKYSSASFKRATGVHKEVFLELTEIIRTFKEIHRKSPSSGRKAYLIIEEQLLMYLMYIREYRTQFHVGIAYGLSESRVCECVKIIEDIIIQDKRYHLSGKKELLKSESSIEVVIIDVGESPLERPKKNKGAIIQAKRNDIPINSRL